MATVTTLVVDRTEPALVANGATNTAPTVRKTGGQNGRNLVHVELSGPFEGLWLDVWVNFKRGLLRGIDSRDNLANGDLFCTLVVDHNLTFEDGEPYAKPLDTAAVDDMALDLYQAVCDAVSAAIQADVPKA